ncbi:hypothetical protein KJ636_03815 [Patescibacteria group bacterium]|nr:hypothetical protein [Patescibacteria group bacterium]MBU4481775.1 hypothetical protein [Patescibacteria group bacterium]
MRKNQKIEGCRFYRASSTKSGYVIGVDGGGSKTTAVLADLRGKFLARNKTGSSHPRHLGFERAVLNVANLLKPLIKKSKDGKILATFLGLPAMEEEFKFKKEIIKKELFKIKSVSKIFKGKVIIGSDQLVGFSAGTNEKDGVMLIGGSGCAAHGWVGKKEVKVSGWGYLTEEGSSFWIGQKGLQAVWDDLDERGPKTILTKLFFRKLGIKNEIGLVEKIYKGNTQETVASLSFWVNNAAEKGDKIAEDILIAAGKELALSANTVIKRLNFQRKKFPLVLVGSVFKSKIILDTVKKEIKKLASGAVFIQPKQEPVTGAVKLALQAI